MSLINKFILPITNTFVRDSENLFLLNSCPHYAMSQLSGFYNKLYRSKVLEYIS